MPDKRSEQHFVDSGMASLGLVVLSFTSVLEILGRLELDSMTTDEVLYTLG